MEPSVQPTKKENKKLSLPRFALAVGATTFLYVLSLQTVSPSMWTRQLESAGHIALVAFLFHVFLGGFEFFFHRYVLHCAVFRWLKKFYKDHTLHHALTKIFRKKSGPEDGGQTEVVNRYPIVDEKQYESSFFPYWGLAGFTIFFSLITVPLQWLMPHTPILLGSFAAMTFSYCLYELLHALEHVPYPAFWKPFIESPTFGGLGKWIYGFHMFHHANIYCNMAISGVFGLPLFDWLFGTYKQPSKLLLDGTLASEDDFSAPKPCRLIRWLDTRLIAKPKAA
ncbi:MAG: hypothetical protein Q7S86_04605 [bacterium]|nr:hypothetical protein [bacterium]